MERKMDSRNMAPELLKPDGGPDTAMDGYLSVRQAAEKWGVSERRISQYCLAGRIPGAMRFGRCWAIPAGARKPDDPRRGKQTHSWRPQEDTVLLGLMPLMNTPFEPGQCTEVIQRMPEGPQKDIALAEYFYFSGQPEQAMQKAELYLTCQETANRISACLIYAYACLSVGRIHHARYALAEINRTLEDSPGKSPHLRAAGAFAAFASAVLLHLPLPENMPRAQEFLPLLPPGLRAFALYVQAHYLYLKGEYGRSIGLAEGALAMGADRYPIPAIYLHLVAVMGCMSIRQVDQAQAHLLAAWELARPDDLIEGLGEHHGLLGGMLEVLIKPGWPEEFRRIIDITYRFSSGWRRVHNPLAGHDVADDLTTTEFAMAMLAARGWTNQEIAKHLSISPNTVKWHISQVMKKLCVTNRKELNKYMLQ